MLEPKTHTEHSGRSAHIPETMAAAAIDHFGSPEVLNLHVLPVPKIAATEVLSKLDAAGVGRWDADIRAGWLSRQEAAIPACPRHGWGRGGCGCWFGSPPH
jgi:NADPH2:quinone reductase